MAVAGVGNVTIDVAGSVGATTAAGGAQAAPGAALATTAVTARVAGHPEARPRPAPGLPTIAPPATLVQQLTDLPATWDTAGSLLETGVTPAAFTKAMVATAQERRGGRRGGRRRAATRDAAPQEVRHAWARCTSAPTGWCRPRRQDAATQVGADLVSETVKPTLTTSVTQLMTTIDDEVKRIMVTPPAGVAALGTPDPNMTAMVTA